MTKEYHKQRREKLAKAGLCVNCGSRPRAFLCSMCDSCISIRAKSVKRASSEAKIKTLKDKAWRYRIGCRPSEPYKSKLEFKHFNAPEAE